MATYWLNYTTSQPGETYSYHVLNLLIHAATLVSQVAAVGRLLPFLAKKQRRFPSRFLRLLFGLITLALRSLCECRNRDRELCTRVDEPP